VSGSVFAGAALAAVSAACYDGAVAVQALDARTAPAAEGRGGLRLLTVLARRRRWLAGTALAILGWPFQLGALALAPLTVVQPVLSLGLVLLLFLGQRMLGERAGAREIGGVAAITAGVGVLAWAAPERSDVHAGTTAVAISLAALALVAVVPWLLRSAAPGGVLVLAAGAGFAGSALTSKLLVDELQTGTLAIALAWAAGTAALAGLGLGGEMAALQRLGATWVAAGAFVLQTVIPVLLAPALFGERWSNTPGGGLAVGAGLAAVAAGSAVLAAAPGVRRLSG
jgi:drug/metabolite transporter (DMT)-like permease